jgi:hypothetical protein
MNNVIAVIDLNNFLSDEDKRDGFVENEISLTCLKECIDEAHSKAYTYITAEKNPDERLKRNWFNN